jgi:hypothetical protein
MREIRRTLSGLDRISPHILRHDRCLVSIASVRRAPLSELLGTFGPCFCFAVVADMERLRQAIAVASSHPVSPSQILIRCARLLEDYTYQGWTD